MISIVMPSFNRQAYLAETIESVLRQEYQDWELIIVDDGSTDGSKYLYDYYTTKDKRVKVIYQENAGISAARNRGIKESKGEYIAVMDSDDLMSPNRLKLQLKKIKDCDFVYSSYYIGDRNAGIKQIFVPPFPVKRKDIMRNSSWPHVTIMARKKCFIDNPYRDDFRVNDDAWLVYKWFVAGYKARYIREPLVIVRMHDGSTSNSYKEQIAKTQKIMDSEYEKNSWNI